MTSKIVVGLLITLVVVTAKPDVRNSAEDVAKERLFFSNFWIPLPFVPTRPPTAAVTTGSTTATSTCTVSMNNAVGTAVTAVCPCGTSGTIPMCAAGNYCTVTTAGVGTCTAAPAACPAAPAATPAVCFCGTALATGNICIAPTNGCASTAAPMTCA